MSIFQQPDGTPVDPRFPLGTPTRAQPKEKEKTPAPVWQPLRPGYERDQFGNVKSTPVNGSTP